MQWPLRPRIISLTQLRASTRETWTVKDDSPRGCCTKDIDEIVVGDYVLVAHVFTLVTP